MALANLDNLVKTGDLRKESPDQSQIDALIKSAKTRLADVEVVGISEENMFSSAYSAAHSISLAAMRWHGYRSDNRYLVFQCLQHTVGLANAKWRALDKCHKHRNLFEYDGLLDITPELLEELISLTKELLVLVEALGPVK